MRRLILEPLTQDAFAPFGDVIETRGSDWFPINNGSTRRYHALSQVQLSGSEDAAILNIFRADATPMPLVIRMLERHPRGSQAFVPLKRNPFLVVVAPPGETPDPARIRAFRAEGWQGLNYGRGVWHHPVIALSPEDDFLVVDRQGSGANCDEFFFEEADHCLLDPSFPGIR